ncbi:hypothetical protein [Aliiroseovarius sp.]|uniref:hypothetical protein n=1 Tax=Aliiroseovarius sp. TaxID=1872442 RepID=UPI003BAD4CAD
MDLVFRFSSRLFFVLGVSSIVSGLICALFSVEHFLDYRRVDGQFQAWGRQSGDWVNIPAWLWLTGRFSDVTLAAGGIVGVFIALTVVLRGPQGKSK